MKILVLDIETRPHLAHVWSLWNQNVGASQVVDTGSVICFAAKWLDKKRVHFYSDFHDGHDVMLQRAWELIDEADAVVTYNGIAFDLKHLFREFLLAGMPPPSPHADIDLYRVIRSRFKFASNKLDFVVRQLGFDGKLDTGGFELWVACMAGDAKAWTKMRRYNCGDVKETERLYYRVRPYISRHPNVALHDGAETACPKCGHEGLERRGYRCTTAGVFQQYLCRGCGGWSRGSQRLSTTSLRETS